MRSRLRRHAALVLLTAVAAVVVVGMAAWTALRPASNASEPLPEPIQVATVPGSSTESRPSLEPAPAPPPTSPNAPDPTPRERVPADVVPPPPLPDDDDDDDDGGDDDDDGTGDDGADD